MVNADYRIFCLLLRGELKQLVYSEIADKKKAPQNAVLKITLDRQDNVHEVKNV